MEMNGLCGLSVTQVPVIEPVIRNISRDCADGELFYVRSNVEDSNPSFDQVCFYLLVETPTARIYAETDRYNSGDITDAAIAQIDNVFNNSTQNADWVELQQGILAAELQIFGQAPMINGSDQVNILLMDVRDNFSGSGNYVGGYFDPNDQTDNPTSNQKNIIYIDCDPVDLISGNPEEALFTLAHEFQHLLHFASDPDEHDDNGNFNPWLDEGLSDLAPSILGLGHRNYGYYLSNTLVGLDQWVGNGLEYYAKSALFFQYFYETEGLDAVTAIFQDSDYSRIESLKNYLGVGNFDAFFEQWVRSTISGAYPGGDCIFGTSAQGSIRQELQLGENEVVLDETIDFNPYSSWHVAIPSVAQKYEIVDILPAHSSDLLYDLDQKNFLSSGSDNDWSLNSDTAPLLFSKIIYNSAPSAVNIYFHLNLSVGLGMMQYDGNMLSMFLNYEGGTFHATNEFPQDAAVLVSGISFKVGSDAPVTVKVRKKGMTFTPSYSETICAPNGPGWTTIDLSAEGIFIENDVIFIELETVGNAIGYSSSYPDNHSNSNNHHSFYSLDGENFNNISSLTVGGQPLQGNWIIRLFYADSTSTQSNASDEKLSVYPNPFFPSTQDQLTATVFTSSNEHITLKIYNLLGERVITLYDGSPPPDAPIRVHWSGLDSSGRRVSSGVYLIMEEKGKESLTAKLLLIH